MANHPITLISPTQIMQSSAVTSSDQFATSNSSAPPIEGQGETSTSVSGGTKASGVTVAPGTVAPDAYAMQANDSTAFVFGSTATNQAPASNQYTTVDDTVKSSLQATILEDQTIRERKNRQNSPFKKKKLEKDRLTTDEEEAEDEAATTSLYSIDAKKTLARAMEKGIVIM